jgi:hypothetical protein
VTVSPTEVVGGVTNSTGTVTLSSATTSSLVVELGSNGSAASVPGTVTVAAGKSTATFTITTSSVATQTPVKISALANGSLQTTTLKVDPLEDHFVITPLLGSGTASAGQSFNFTITAKNPGNVTDTAYAGIVHFTSTDPLATLPANTTLTAGTGTFSATLATLPRETITATDTVYATITGSVLITVQGFTVTAANAAILQGNVTATAITVPFSRNYLGSVTLSTAELPVGITASFTSPTVSGTGAITETGTSTLDLRAASSVATGPVVITVKATAGAYVQSTTFTLTVKPNLVLTSIVVTPATPSVAPTATQQFTATAYDQYATALVVQPTFTWSKAGDGTISSTGLFTAGSAAGTCKVTATASRVSGSTTVTVP